jgi:hypothetical protein
MSTVFAANQGPNDPQVELSGSDDAILKKIRHRYHYHFRAWKNVRDDGAKDVQALSPEGPWDADERKKRKDAGRPCVHLDQLTQYTNGFMGEVRQKPSAVKVIPAGSGATDQSAELRGNRLRQIEYESKATQATLTALECAVERGYGAFGLTIDYKAWDSDELAIKYRRFANPDSVSWDPDAKEADWADMQDAFVHDWMTWDDFAERFGETAQITNFGTEQQAIAPDWIFADAQMVQVSEYYCIEKTPRTILWLDDPQSPKGKRRVFRDELVGAKVLKDRVIMPDGSEVKILDKRTTQQPKVMQYLTNGIEILDRTELPGTQIPVFPIVGRERFIPEGNRVRRVLYSYIRMGVDGQMLFDYYKTNEAEEVGLTPKPKYAGYAGQFETNTDWKNINRSTEPYVEFVPVVDPVSNQVLPLPRWDSYTPNIQALDIGSESARRAIQSALGSYGFTRLDDTNVKSGKAIQQLDSKGDTTSYHLIDSYQNAIQRAGRVANSWLDDVEGTDPAEVGIRKLDGTHATAKINQPSTDEQGQQQFLRYKESDDAQHDVTISTGPSYQSQREEATNFADTLVNSGQPYVEKIMDLVVKLKNLGPIGDQIAERLTPPEFQNQDPNAPLNPQQVQQQMQHYEAALKDAMQQLDEYKQGLPKIQADQQIAAQRIQADMQIASMKIQAEQQRQAYADDVKLAIAEVQAKQKMSADDLSAFMTRMEHTLKLLMQSEDHQHEAAMGAAQAAASGAQQQNQIAADQQSQQQQLASQVTHRYNPETDQIEPVGAGSAAS